MKFQIENSIVKALFANMKKKKDLEPMQPIARSALFGPRTHELIARWQQAVQFRGKIKTSLINSERKNNSSLN